MVASEASAGSQARAADEASITNETSNVNAIRGHYDRLSVLYRALWGEHIHHGYWENGESPATAQVRLVERLAVRAAIPHGARVLDVGSGFGGSSLWLAQNLGCSVLGLNISPVQTIMATHQARVAGLADRAHFEVKDANHLDLPSESFDAVWVIESSEHLDDKAAFIESCARVLKPGGVLSLCAWLVADDLLSSGQARLVSEVCRGMLCPSLATRNGYVAWMRRSGLGEIQAEDITRHVEKTWIYCASIVRRPAVKSLLRMSDTGTRDFVEAFSAIDRAYAGGFMAYGMFTAKRA